MSNKSTLIDTHAHLSFPDFDKDREEMLKRAWDAGLEAIITIGAGEKIAGNEAAIKLCESDERIFAALGIHPHDADAFEKEWIEHLLKLAKHPRVVAIGEIGLDYHYDHSKPEKQREVFRQMLGLAKRAKKPIIIHDREAHEDTLKIIKEEDAAKLGGVFHCFSGDLKFAEKVLAQGFCISIPGIVTFQKAKQMQEVVAEIPLEKMVIETDCPFLAPAPYRGQRNEPCYVAGVAAKIAEIKGLAAEDVSRVTTLTARRIFKLPGAEILPSIAYCIRNSLYLNITNRCNMACKFCPKFSDYEVKGYYLKLMREPSVEEVFQAMGQPEKFDEVVFCGYGEPTLRLEVLKVIAQRMKDRGVSRVRLNTDGLANLVYGRNILPELKGLIDAISISLNAADAAGHLKICPSKYGEKAYEEVCRFILEAKKWIPEVAATVVALPGLDIEACRKKADELGVPLRVREYMNVG